MATVDHTLGHRVLYMRINCRTQSQSRSGFWSLSNLISIPVMFVYISFRVEWQESGCCDFVQLSKQFPEYSAKNRKETMISELLTANQDKKTTKGQLY